MKWSDIGGMNCAIARTLSVVGDRWTILILRNAFLNTRRFDDFQQQLGMTRHLLADRLKALVAEGILERKPVAENSARFEYGLTPKGHSLLPILLTLAAWGNEWKAENDGPLVTYYHVACGKKTVPTVTCSECGEPLLIGNVLPMLNAK